MQVALKIVKLNQSAFITYQQIPVFNNFTDSNDFESIACSKGSFQTNPKDLNRAAKSPALNAFGWQTRKQQNTAKEHHGVKLMTV